MELWNVIEKINAVEIPKKSTVTQMCSKEGGDPYKVWKIETESQAYILKEAKEKEREIYESVLSKMDIGVPKLYQIIEVEGKSYLLMEYIAGEDLCQCDEGKLKLVLDALIAMQEQTWDAQMEVPQGLSFAQSLAARKNRGEYLSDPLLEQVYGDFLALYQTLPRTFCHDDLLPFNVIVSPEKAVQIDWEAAGILPYPTPLARLLAHTSEDPNAMFYMTEAHRTFAIDYYFHRLLEPKGISYENWKSTLAYFLFYEYCEWVFVGNKYGVTHGEYYQKYLPLAKEQAKRLLKSTSLQNTNELP